MTTRDTVEVARLEAVDKSYTRGRQVVQALRSVDLSVAAGTLVAVHGRSGSGKTTLLNILGGLDRADAGQVCVCGVDLRRAPDTDLLALRRERIAFVFQGFGLLPMLSAAENVEVPLRLRGVDGTARSAQVGELLDLVGLGARSQHRPNELSGGEQQRVAIARALAGDPQLLVADEPTGQLDSRTGVDVMRLIHRVVIDRGVAVVVATHDVSIIDDANRRVELQDGRVIDRVGG